MDYFLDWISTTKGTLASLFAGLTGIILNTVNDIRTAVGDITAIGIGICSLILVILAARIKYIQFKREQLRYKSECNEEKKKKKE